MVDIRLSKSKILDYINCPRMFYFKHCTTFGKNKQQTSAALENGTMLHEIFEAYNTNRPKFEQYFGFVKGNEEFEKNIYGFFSLLNYFGIDRAAYAEPRIYSEDINVLGFIDAIYWVPEGSEVMVYNPKSKKDPEEPEYVKKVLKKDEYWLIDYKTGKFHANRNSEMMLELYIYEHLANQFLNERYGSTGVEFIDRVGFFYTKFPEVKFVRPVTKVERNRAMKKFNGIVEKISNDEFARVSNNLCAWCAFKGICDQYHDDVLKELKDHVLMAV